MVIPDTICISKGTKYFKFNFNVSYFKMTALMYRCKRVAIHNNIRLIDKFKVNP